MTPHLHLITSHMPYLASHCLISCIPLLITRTRILGRRRLPCTISHVITHVFGVLKLLWSSSLHPRLDLLGLYSS